MKFKLKLAIICLIMISKVLPMGLTQVWLEPIGGTDGTKFYLGQELTVQVRINTYGEKITGAAIYLTLDPNFLKLDLQDDGKPFKRGNFFTTNPDQNDLHDDNINNPNANGIPGLQLDFFQQTQISTGSGDRPTKQGSGILCYFDVIVVGIPENDDNEFTLGYDDDFLNVRESGYFIAGRPGERQDYNFAVPMVMNIFGSSIDPPLPDTTITPGSNLDFYLGDHFYAKDFDLGTAIWSFDILQDVAGTTVTLDTTNDADMIYVTSSANSKGKLILDVKLGIEGTSFESNQIWYIYVNHRPSFNKPIQTIIINEDIEGPVAISTLVTDLDDPPANLYFRAVGDSNVTVTKGGAVLNFQGKENWFGNTKIRLFVTDSLSPEISEEIQIRVEPVNDYPVIDFSGSYMFNDDTLYLHHDETISFNLDDIVYDVDNQDFTWTNSQDEKLDIEIIDNKNMKIKVSEAGAEFFGLIPITLTVYDPAIAYDQKVCYIKIKSYSPEILPIKPIMMHADSTVQIKLSDYVNDNDSPLSNLNFTVQVVDTATNVVDHNVFTNYNSGTITLSISSTPGHAATDYVKITVRDLEGNSVTGQFLLIIVETFAPRILKIPGIVVYQDSTIQFDLEPYIVDVRDKANELIYNISGNDIFESVEIGDDNASLVFKSYAEVFGSDTLQLIVENSVSLRDTADIVAYCIPNDNKPVLLDISDLDLFWNREYDWIDLDEYVFDAFTSLSDLQWEISYSSEMFTVEQNNGNELFIKTTSVLGIGKIVLKVTNDMGSFTEKEIRVTVSKDQIPVWSSFPDIYMVRTQPVRTMNWTLAEKCKDEETPSNKLVYSVEYDSDVLKVDIDFTTSAVKLTVVDTSQTETSIRFTAKDESQNFVKSQYVKIFLSDGIAPGWKTIPSIYMKNTETYEDLRLLDYCQDTDDNDSDLIFSGIASNSNIKVEILEDSQVRITALNGIFGENFYVIFKVTDTQDNVVQKSAKLIITDDMPPRGFVNYVTNPVLTTRVDFIVTTDVSVKSVTANFKKLPSTAIALDFSEMNTSDDGKLWTDDYKFTMEGTYKLIVEMVDNNNIETTDTTVMTVTFPSNTGASTFIGTASDQIVFEYPEMNYTNKMFFITESDIKANEEFSLSKTIVDNAIYNKKYKIQSGLNANEALFTLRFNPEQKLDKYHSFFKIENGEYIKIDTWQDASGEFKAYITEDCEVCFQKSSFPAKEEIVPENHFTCYPNPFNPTVNMKFLLKSPQRVNLQIYNLLGQKVYDEVKNFNPGINQMNWNGVDETGNIMPSGIYFVMISKNNKPMKIQKVTLFK